MVRAVVLRIENGDFERGFHVKLQILEDSDLTLTILTASLPPFPEFIYQYRRWQQSLYYEMMALNRLNKIPAQLTNFSFDELQQQANLLHNSINNWLNSNSFLPIQRTIMQKMDYRSEFIELLVQTDDIKIAQIPWHLWDLLDRYPKLEIYLSRLEYEPIKKLSPKQSNNTPDRIKQRSNLLTVARRSSDVFLSKSAPNLTLK